MSDATDRRGGDRYPVSASASCSFASPVVENFGAVRIRDISMQSVGLLANKRVEPGTLLAVTLSNKAKGFSKTVLVRVVHATQLPGNYLIGGTFVEPLSYQEMAVLVM